MQPIDYLEQAVQLIETHSYYQPSIEKWTQHKASVFAQLTSATTLDDVHHLIRDLLYTLGDNHSHLLPPNWQTNPQKTAQNLKSLRGAIFIYHKLLGMMHPCSPMRILLPNT